ncbi:MAG: tripartite tricarboxylate transporter substrate binding protein [Rhodoferax sp.]|nr:tripartite tricarboxylate transporter substrate binding protein [Rhodoferax sp.]
MFARLTRFHQICVRGASRLLLALAAGLSLSVAHAQWPDKPIRIVVPYPAGGLTDIVTRVLSDEVGRNLGTTVIVENKAGAGGQIGLDAVLRAPSDGYTVALVVPATMVTLPLTNPNFRIKPLEQFAPITVAVDTFLSLVVDPKLGPRTLPEFIDYAKKNPGKLNYGTPGVGTSFHFNNVMMARKLGIDTVHVPYQGEVKILTDLSGGLLQYALVTNTAKPFIDGGKVQPIAVTSATRVVSLPDVPTFKEAGSDFTSDGWVGYVAAAGTPKPIMDKLNAAFVKALRTPAVRDRLTDMGYVVSGNSPEAFADIVREATQRYSDVLKAGQIKLN